MNDKQRDYVWIAMGFILVAESVVTFALLAWSIRGSFSAHSPWLYPLTGLVLLAFFTFVSPVLLRRIPRLQTWSARAMRGIQIVLLGLLIGLWTWLANGPAVSYRYYLHTATWEIVRGYGREVLMLNYRESHKRQTESGQDDFEPYGGIYDRNRGIWEVPGEGVQIYDQEFIQAHRDREGSLVPIVLRGRLAFGAEFYNGVELYAIAEFTERDWNFIWGGGPIYPASESWRGDSPEYEVDEATVKSILNGTWKP